VHYAFLGLVIAIIFFGIKGDLSVFQQLLLSTLIFGFLLINRRIADIRDQWRDFFSVLARGGLTFEHTYEDEDDDDPAYTNGRHPVIN